jgi:hypothetical protein
MGSFIHDFTRSGSEADRYDVDGSAKVGGPVPMIHRRRVLGPADANDLVIGIEHVGVVARRVCVAEIILRGHIVAHPVRSLRERDGNLQGGDPVLGAVVIDETEKRDFLAVEGRCSGQITA